MVQGIDDAVPSPAVDQPASDMNHSNLLAGTKHILILPKNLATILPRETLLL